MSILNNTVQEEDTLYGKYLTFWIDKQRFGIPIADVVQIIGIQDITQVSEFPYYAKGIINLRGNIIPVIDIRLRFQKEEAPYDTHTCIIVTNINESYVGFIVDEVNDVADIEDEKISMPPKISGENSNRYLIGVATHENDVVLLLNSAKIIDKDEINRISSVI